MKLLVCFVTVVLLAASAASVPIDIGDEDYQPTVDSPAYYEFPASTAESHEELTNNKLILSTAFRSSKISLPSLSTPSDFKSQEPSKDSSSPLPNIPPDLTATNVTSPPILSAENNTNAPQVVSASLTSEILIETPTEVVTSGDVVEYSSTFQNILETTIGESNPNIRLPSYAMSSPVVNGPFLQPTESAAILAAMFVGVALFGYFGLVMWRRILEKRYGNRELLINEEFYDVNDLKYFEL